jgi:hypothetical protein
MLGGVQITGKAMDHAREMLATPKQESVPTVKVRRGKQTS